VKETLCAVTDLDAIEAALRNPATHQLVKTFGSGSQDDRVEAWVALYQLVPLSDHRCPWVVLTAGVGKEDSEGLQAHESLRSAEDDYAQALEWLEDSYGFGPDDDDEP
jgi:hypothetical protein